MVALGGLISKSTAVIQSSIESLSLPAKPSGLAFVQVGAPLGKPLAPEPPNTDMQISKPTPKVQSSADKIRVQTVVQKRCPPSCPCRCHQVRHVQTKHNGFLAQQAFGQLFLSYNGVPTWNQSACDTKRCIQGSDMSVRLVYVFPSWLYGKALDFYLSWKSVTGQGASLHLRMPRAIPKTDSIFWAILENKVDVVQSRFSSREVLPTDIDDDMGMPLLAVSSK